MSYEQMQDVLQQYRVFLDRNGQQGQINLTGGEPLLHPDFYRLATLIRKQGLRLGLLSNGTLIDKDHALALKQLGLCFVQISLDGDKAYHDAIRWPGSYDQAFEGIDRLKALGQRVHVSFTANRINHASFRRLYKACMAHGVDKLWWDRVVIPAGEANDDLSLNGAEFARLVAVSQRLERRSRMLNGSSMLSNRRALQFIMPNGRLLGGYRCSAGKGLIVLLADGSLMPCRRLPFVIGNVSQKSLGDLIEESELMRHLATFQEPDDCVFCRFKVVCGGGSRCISQAQTGSWRNQDPQCLASETDRLTSKV